MPVHKHKTQQCLAGVSVGVCESAIAAVRWVHMQLPCTLLCAGAQSSRSISSAGCAWVTHALKSLSSAVPSKQGSKELETYRKTFELHKVLQEDNV